MTTQPGPLGSRRRARRLAAALAASALLAAACGGDDDDTGSTGPADSAGTGEQVAPASTSRLTYAYDTLFTEPFTELQQDVADAGIELELELAGADYEELDQRIQSDLLADSPPPLTMMGLNRIRPYVESGRIVPIDDLVAADEEFDLAQYDQGFLDLMTYDGELYGLPLAVSTPILYVNTEVFTAAGLDPEDPPDTWEEVTAAAQEIVDAEAAEYGAYVDWSITGNWMIQALVESAGGSLLTEDESDVAFDSPEGVEAVSFLADLVDGGLMPPVESADGLDTFLNGQSGMLVTSTAFLGSVVDAGIDVRTAVLPIPEGGERRTPAGGNALVILADDEADVQAAWEVMKVFTGVDGSTAITRATGYMPVNSEAATSEEHLAPDLEDPNRATSLEQVETLVPWVQFPGQNGAEITDIIRNEVFSAITGEASPEDALDSAAEQVRGLLP